MRETSKAKREDAKGAKIRKEPSEMNRDRAHLRPLRTFAFLRVFALQQKKRAPSGTRFSRNELGSSSGLGGSGLFGRGGLRGLLGHVLRVDFRRAILFLDRD